MKFTIGKTSTGEPITWSLLTGLITKENLRGLSRALSDLSEIPPPDLVKRIVSGFGNR